MSEAMISGFRWFAVQVMSNQEMKVKQYFERFVKREGYEDCVKEILVPTEKVAEVKKGKKTTRVRKFYPGYVFIHMFLYDENEDLKQDLWNFVREAQGVISIIGGQTPIPLKEEEISRILSQIKGSEGKEVPKVQYSVGDDVKITDGPFLNLTGKIDEIDVEKGKLIISVSIFGRFTPVELEHWQVEMVEE